MQRKAAYFDYLKFFFQRNLIVEKLDRRTAWKNAKNDAAVYAFLAPTANFRILVEV